MQSNPKCFASLDNSCSIWVVFFHAVLPAASTACRCGPPVVSRLPPESLLTPSPIGNRWETLAAGYCQMEQILITASASSVYSLQASPPPCAPVRHLTCSTLTSSADMSVWYALYCWLQDIYHILAQMGNRRGTGVPCRTVHTSLFSFSSDSGCYVGTWNLLVKRFCVCTSRLNLTGHFPIRTTSFIANVFQCTEPMSNNVLVWMNLPDVGWDASTCRGKKKTLFFLSGCVF